MITIYTTETCPKCKILKKKMDLKGVSYKESVDLQEMERLGIKSVPMLRLDGDAPLVSFETAVKWLQERVI